VGAGLEAIPKAAIACMVLIGIWHICYTLWIVTAHLANTCSTLHTWSMSMPLPYSRHLSWWACSSRGQTDW